MSVDLALVTLANAPNEPAVFGATSDRERGRTVWDSSLGTKDDDGTPPLAGSIGWKPRGENWRNFSWTDAGNEGVFRGAVGGGGRDFEVKGVGKGEGSGVLWSDESGIRLTSSAVVLIRVGAPISKFRTFLDAALTCEADLFCANFSFKHLKSANRAVEDDAGVVDALRACRVGPGEYAGVVYGYVAERGVVSETVGMRYGSLQRSPRRGDGRAFWATGGMGVRNLSLGLRVKTSASPML